MTTVGLRSLLSSRKFWITMSGFLSVVFEHFGILKADETQKIVMLAAALVAGIAIDGKLTGGEKS